MSLYTATGSAGLLLLGLLTSAAPLYSRPSLEWGLTLEEKIGGDSNVMRLSPGELDRLDGDPSFQADAKGPADLRLDHRVLADLRWNLPERKLGRLLLSLDGKVVSYLENTANNYGTQRWSLDWQTKPGWGAELSWFGMSNYYLRDFTDGDTGQIRGAEFDSNEYRLRLRARSRDLGPVGRPTATLLASFEEVFYNGWFTEYDTETFEAGIRLDGDLPADLSASLQFYFADTDNVGLRQGATGLSEGDSESGDGSHQENRLQVGLGWSGEWLQRDLSLDLDFSWRHREYQSTLGEIEDPVHAGRSDDRYVLSLNKIWRVSRQFSVRPFVEREWRTVDGPWPRLPEYKDYGANRLGVALRYVIR